MVRYFQAGCLLVVLSSVLINSAHSDQPHVRHKRAALTCSSGQTLVKTGYLYDSNKCSDLIGMIADYYKLEYRQECQRWLGLSSLPSSVSDARIPTAECYEFSNGTSRYRAEVCCDGQTTAQRCFTCATRNVYYDSMARKYTTYNCDHGGDVTTCPAGQVCQTVYTSKRVSGSVRYSLREECAAEASCDAMKAKNTALCVYNKVAEPQCTLCCSGPFCNYDNQVKRIYPYTPPKCYCYNGGTCVNDTTDARGYRCECRTPFYGSRCQYNPCSRSPCKNKAICQYQNTSPYYYRCYCRPGWTGQNCTTAASLCTTNLCENGGTCYDHGTKYGWRCLCASGYIGDYCETKSLLTCSTSEQEFEKKNEYASITSGNCSSRMNYYEKQLNDYSMKFYCKLHMKGTALLQQVFDKTRLVEHSLRTCEHGEGAVWFTRDACCPACFSNPCQNDGLCLSTKAGNDYVCACQFGYEGKNCQNRVSMCFASGDPHYKTFDGEMLHFQGICKYTMVSPKSTATDIPAFKVQVKNEHRYGNTHASYTRYVEVHVYGKIIRMAREKNVTIDGEQVYPDVIQSGFKVVSNGRFVRLETDFGLAVESDGNFLTIVKVPATFASNIQGLCADFDGNRNNDFILSNGTDVSSDPHRHSHVGNSHKVDDTEDPKCPSTIDPPPPVCAGDKETLFRGNDYCGLIKDKSGVFGKCLNNAGVWSLAPAYHENCMYDTCANQNDLELAKEAACGSLEVLAADCASKGRVIDWREAAGCPLTCPAGSNMVYKVRTSACIPTCANPTADKACGLPDTESCTCETGMLFWKGKCVKPSECGCYHSDKYFSIGDSWYSSDCSTKYSCVACTTCAYPVGEVESAAASCPVGQICKMEDGVYGCVQNAVDGKWGGWGSWTTCTPGTCSSASESRNRACNNPAPSNGGKNCIGDATENRPCTCVDGKWSPWGPWTTCSGSCNAWTRTHERRCDSPAPSSGGKDCVGDSTGSEQCTCALGFNAAVDCAKCVGVINGVGYLPNLCDCGSYYQCENIDGVWHGHLRHCSKCTQWSQDDMTCGVRILDCTDGDGSSGGGGSSVTGDTCVKDDGTTKKKHSSSSQYIWVVSGVEYTMSCAPGTAFDLSKCDCVLSNTPVVVPTSPVMLCLPFSEGYNNFAPSPGWGWVSVQGVTITYRTPGNKCALFNGAGHLEIPRFQNYAPQNGIGIDFWFRRTGGSGAQGLVTNNCVGESSIEIVLTSETTLFAKVKSVASDGTIHRGTVTVTSVSVNAWHNVVYSYNGQYLMVYVDGVKYTSGYTPGKIVNTQCTMIVGMYVDMGTTKYLNGNIDELCFYEGPITPKTS